VTCGQGDRKGIGKAKATVLIPLRAKLGKSALRALHEGRGRVSLTAPKGAQIENP